MVCSNSLRAALQYDLEGVETATRCLARLCLPQVPTRFTRCHETTRFRSRWGDCRV